MKYVNANIIRELRTDLDPNIIFVDPSLTLKSSDFYPEDRHYNKNGHLQHGRNIANRLNDEGIFNCEKFYRHGKIKSNLGIYFLHITPSLKYHL